MQVKIFKKKNDKLFFKKENVITLCKCRQKFTRNGHKTIEYIDNGKALCKQRLHREGNLTTQKLSLLKNK